MERGKSLRRKFMTHSRSSSEKEAESRAQSEGRGSGDFEVRMLSLAAVSVTKPGRSRSSAQEDDELAHEFDELMRSGSTMKVSLTPDRLRTMEVRDL